MNCFVGVFDNSDFGTRVVKASAKPEGADSTKKKVLAPTSKAARGDRRTAPLALT